MSEYNTTGPAHTQWIERCAQRLLRHHIVTPDEAAELACELLACIGAEGCPERAADNMLRCAMEV